jgi:hypothetical protein
MSITVKELIEQLGYMDQDAEVHFSYNYGDHWRTQVAPKVGGVEEGIVQYSSYHRMDKMIEDEEDTYDEETGELVEGARRVVVIS